MLEWLNLYQLFAVYTFGSPEWAIFGVAAIIMAITYMGKWSPALRYIYVLGFIYASFIVIGNKLVIMLGVMMGLAWMGQGLLRWFTAYRGQT